MSGAAELPGAIRDAAARLAPHDVRTPLAPSAALGARARFKCEHLQRTGSFKLRGALNKVLALSRAELAKGIVTSSTGNHGLGVAEALRVAGGRGTVVVSSTTSPYKMEKLTRAGLEVITESDDPMTAELAARALADRTGRVYISAYNDWDVVAGQGTIGVELAEQWPAVEAIYITVGGGGLISGVASYIKSVNPAVRIVGCWPERATAMHASIEAGRILELPDEPTLSDGSAGNVEPGSITFALCRDLIDAHVLVSETEIATAMRDVFRADGARVEGAAGVALAAYRKADRGDEASVVVLCGGNVSDETFAQATRGA
ncbi:MAG: threonine/serine dehydratase [Gemmatimonadaceae bacterium]